MNEKLVEQVARAICGSLEADNFDELRKGGIIRASYMQQAEAAIAAHSAFIREAAWKDDVVKAGYDECAIEWNDDACKRCLPEIFRAMLDQIERTPDEG